MRLLVGVDGSERSHQALREALEDAQGADATVTVLLYTPEEQALESHERWVRDRLEDAQVEATVQQVEGNPGSRLVELAESGDYDRIVLPGGRRSPLGKIQFDTTIEFVLMNAQTSVTLAR